MRGISHDSRRLRTKIVRKNDDFLLILVTRVFLNSRPLVLFCALTLLRAPAFLPGASRGKPALPCGRPRQRGLKQRAKLLRVRDGHVHEPANLVVPACPRPGQIGVRGDLSRFGMPRPVALSWPAHSPSFGRACWQARWRRLWSAVVPATLRPRADTWCRGSWHSANGLGNDG